MSVHAIALVVTLLFMSITFAMYRKLQRKVTEQKISSFRAALLVWLNVLCLPWLLTWIWVPIANHIFTTFPALQTPSWDVGVAISLYLGMCMSYLFGVLSASIISWKFIGRSTHRRSENAT